jgi:hypothetical protein
MSDFKPFTVRELYHYYQFWLAESDDPDTWNDYGRLDPLTFADFQDRLPNPPRRPRWPV